MPNPTQVRESNLNYLLEIVKHNQWSLRTIDLFGKLLSASRKLYPEFDERTHKSYAISTMNKMRAK